MFHSKFLCVALGLALIAAGRAAPAAQQDNADAAREAAKKVAAAWFKALVGADVEAVMKISDVPFSWDRKKLLKDRDALEKLYRQVAADKGARNIVPTEVAVEGDKKLIATHYVGSETNLQLIKILIEDEAIFVLIRPGKQPKVVGFSD